MASDFSIRHAVSIIRRGGVIAYPTDTIYGLGCDPYNQNAVEHINAIKQRDLNKQFILLSSDIEQIKSLVEINSGQEKQITQTTQATSWIVSASQNAPLWLVDENHAITIRISNNQTINKLCTTLNHAIISTSANLSGKEPAKTSLDLHKNFHHCVDKILVADQKTVRNPSKIIRLCDNKIIRN